MIKKESKMENLICKESDFRGTVNHGEEESISRVPAI
jgi:hypothetical protein